MARIKAITKRYNINIDTFVDKTLKKDFKAHSLYIDNEEVKKALKEYELLKYFYKR